MSQVAAKQPAPTLGLDNKTHTLPLTIMTEIPHLPHFGVANI